MRSRTLAGHTQPSGRWRITTAARTLADLGDYLSTKNLRALIYSAIQQEKTTLEQLQRAWASVARRSRLNPLGKLLQEFDDAHDSDLEEQASRIFERHGIVLSRQYRVVVAKRIIRQFDFADPDLKIGVEIDGWAYHSSLDAHQRDRTKDRELAVLGWLTVRFTTRDVMRRPAHMVQVLRSLRERRGVV